MLMTTIIGNPKARSKTRTIAEEAASQLHAILEKQTSEEIEHEMIDLADYAVALATWDQSIISTLLARIEASSCLVIASPTYKATYTGLLKLFLDVLPMNALAGKLAFPIMVGAGYQHQLAVELHLRPLLSELGALCPARGLYVLDSQLDQRQDVLSEWATAQEAVMKALL